MASKSSVTYLPGTDNVIDFQEYRRRKRMREIIGRKPDFIDLSDCFVHPDDDSGFEANRECMRGWFGGVEWTDNQKKKMTDYQPIEGQNILGHHERMMKATEELRRKASWAKTKNSPAPKST